MITTFCHPVDIPVDNTYPHVTQLVYGKTPAKESNQVLKEIFENCENQKLKDILWNLKEKGEELKQGKEYFEWTDILIKSKAYNVYIYVPDQAFVVKGVTHKFI